MIEVNFMVFLLLVFNPEVTKLRKKISEVQKWNIKLKRKNYLRNVE